MKVNQIRYQGIVVYPFYRLCSRVSAWVYHFCAGHFPTDIRIFCRILSHFSIGHFPTDLRIILSHFVAKEVYALLLKSLPRVFFSLPGRAMPGVFFPFLVWAKIWVPPLTLAWAKKQFFARCAASFNLSSCRLESTVLIILSHKSQIGIGV